MPSGVYPAPGRWVWERGAKVRGSCDPTASGARSGRLQLSLNLAAGWGPRRRGPNRCGAAAALGGRAAGAGERRLEASALQTDPEVVGNRGWRPYLRVQEPRAQADLKLIFDPSHDLCLRPAPQGLPARANLALG